jgi:branched-chain amino acid transport system substrate-binding protein
VVNAVELSGDGAIAGTNFHDGVMLGFKEINAAGGVLGRRIETVTLDVQTKPEVARAALARAEAMDASR